MRLLLAPAVLLVACGAPPVPAPPPASAPPSASASLAAPPLPEVTDPVMFVLQDGHASSVVKLAFTPDGRSIVSGSLDSTVRLWDVATGELRASLVRHARDITALAVSPDGARVVSGDRTSDALALFDLSAGAKIASLSQKEPDMLFGLVFTSDGRALLGGGLRGVFRWDLERPEGKPRSLFAGKVEVLALSPDDRRIAVALEYEHPIRVLKTDGGAEVARFEGLPIQAGAMAYSPSGRLFAASGFSGPTMVWDNNRGAVVETLNKDVKKINHGIVWGPDDRFLVVASDGAVYAWNLPGGAPRFQIAGAHAGRALVAAVSPDGRMIATGGDDHAIRLSDASDGALVRVFANDARQRLGHWVFAPEGGAFALGGSEGATRVCRLVAGAIACVRLQGALVNAIAFRRDGGAIAGLGRDDDLRVHDASTGALIAHAPLGRCHGGAVAFSPDDRRVAAGCNTNEVRLWDTGGAAPPLTLQGHSNWIYGLTFSPDGALLASAGGDAQLKLWDAATGTLVKNLEAHPGSWTNYAVTFSPDGAVCVAGAGGAIFLWDHRAGVFKKSIVLPTTPLALAVSPDGAKLASGGGDGSVTLWDMTTARLLATLPPMEDAVHTLSFDPTGAILAAAGRGVRLYRLRDGLSVWVDAFPASGGREALLAHTDDGLVGGDPEALSHVRYRGAGPLPTAPMYPLDRVRSRFYRERLLERFLAGEAIELR